MQILLSAFVAVSLCSFVAHAADLPIREFDAQYCGPQSLKPFKCTDFDPPRDKSISRVCYNPHSGVMLIRMNQLGYCYCGLGSAKFDEFVQSKEMERFYVREIRGQFRCPNDTRVR